MKILFVRPSMINLPFFHYLTIKLVDYPTSSTFPILAALTPNEYSVEVVDGTRSDVNYEEKYDLVGITAVTQEAIKAYEIADEFRRIGVKVVLGGWHTSALPEEAKGHADSVVIGEAEETWPILLKDFKNGKLKSYYQPAGPVNPKKIPQPRRNIYPPNSNIGIYATRGCPYSCEFCTMANPRLRREYRMRPIKDVIEEIRMHPSKICYFFDNSLTINPTYTKQLFREMRGLNKEFYAFGNIDLAKDDEFLKLASDAGCSAWIIGFESINQKSLDSVGKKNRVDDYLSSIKKIHDYGMRIEGGFIFGFDHDTPDIFDETADFIRKSEIDFPNCRVLTPFPGTPLFDRLDKDGRILTRDWSLYNYYHVVFQPKHMTPEELQSGWSRITNEFHSSFNYLKGLLKKKNQNLFTLINKLIVHVCWKKYNL